ncbi:MAG: aspartyl protease family protein [Planctomycetes bacterium]|nr:aspartyl protease family protein [Planctomycetota bacterium]
MGALPLVAAVLPALLQVDAGRAKPGDPPDAILALHRTSFGRVLEEAGDLEIEGTVEGGGHWRTWRVYVRRAPFAFREEWRSADPSVPADVRVSDGEYAWRLRADGTGAPLPGLEATATLERAFFAGALYLDPGQTTGRGKVNGLDSMWHWPGVPDSLEKGRRIWAVNLTTPAGSYWQTCFDAQDGRLHGRIDPFVQPVRWMRYGEWKDIGGLRLPTLWIEGRIPDPNAIAVRVGAVRSGVRHPSERFAGSPVHDLPSLEEVSPLEVFPAAVPGSCSFAVPEARVNGGPPVRALLDTGAESLALDPHFADWLRVPVVGPDVLHGVSGSMVASARWVDSIEFGAHRAVQVRATSAPLPGIAALPRGAPNAVVLAGPTLLRPSPILDLGAGKLLFRGRPTKPLAEIPSGGASRVVEVPYRRYRAYGTASVVDVSVGGKTASVLLDTGVQSVLHLSKKGLSRLGLPTEPGEWMARGAYPFRYGGVGGTGGTDLLVRLESLSLGPVTFERPWVQLTGLGDPKPPEVEFEGLLGAGAFLPFARVGLDESRKVLELDPGPDVRAGPEGGLVVPDPGEFLGLVLEGPDPSAREEPGCLPRVAEVSPGSPADRARVRVGERLLTVEGLPCMFASPSAFNRRLWPAAGKKVSLGFAAPDGSGARIVALP